LHDHLQSYRALSYEDLVGLIGEVQVAEVLGASGVEYQIEVAVHWDHQRGGNIRVTGAIDDGRFRSAFSRVRRLHCCAGWHLHKRVNRRFDEVWGQWGETVKPQRVRSNQRVMTRLPNVDWPFGITAWQARSESHARSVRVDRGGLPRVVTH
jgi:hypothetical protein